MRWTVCFAAAQNWLVIQARLAVHRLIARTTKTAYRHEIEQAPPGLKSGAAITVTVLLTAGFAT